MFQMSRSLNPWREFDEIRQEMNRLLTPATTGPHARFRFEPAMNVLHNEHEVLLTAELPGLSEDDLDLTVTPEAITLKYEAPAPVKEAEPVTRLHRKERRRSSFSRTVTLPFPVNPDQAEASYQNGVLSIKVPRPDQQKPRKLGIRTA